MSEAGTVCRRVSSTVTVMRVQPLTHSGCSQDPPSVSASLSIVNHDTGKSLVHGEIIAASFVLLQHRLHTPQAQHICRIDVTHCSCFQWWSTSISRTISDLSCRCTLLHSLTQVIRCSWKPRRRGYQGHTSLSSGGMHQRIRVGQIPRRVMMLGELPASPCHVLWSVTRCICDFDSVVTPHGSRMDSIWTTFVGAR